MTRLRGSLFIGLYFILMAPLLRPFAEAEAVHALFELDAPAGGPFPSDRFTVADSSQNTGLRVNLPKPDCRARPSDCEDVDVLNTLDGFNMFPRLSIPFDGPIDVNSVTSKTVFLISLENALDLRDSGSPSLSVSPSLRHSVSTGGRRIGINQVVWDPKAHTLHVWSDEFLDQHTRYGLIVTSGVKARNGRPVEAGRAFRRFLDDGNGNYRTALVGAVRAAARTGVMENKVVSASVFTTQSATAILEKIRDQIKAATPAPADFRLGFGGSRTVFKLDQMTGITWNQQTGERPPKFKNVEINLSLLRITPCANSYESRWPCAR